MKLHAVSRLVFTMLLAGAWVSSGCGSDEKKSKPGAEADASDDTSSAGGSGGMAGGGGMPPMMDAGVDSSVDSSADVVVDVGLDRFADAPPRPGPTDPMTVVLFGQLDGIDLTGSYEFFETDDAGASLDICGAASSPMDAGQITGFDLRRTDEFEGTVINVRYSDPVVSNPVVGTYDQFDSWDFTISRFAKIDGATKLVTFRAGQVTTDSELLGDVRAEDLDGTGSLDAFFHITKARRVVDVDEGIKDGDLFLWIAGTCK